MAGPNKKAKHPAKPDSDQEYDSEGSETYNGQEEIQATFEGRNPEGQDFHGIKQLLQQLFLTAHIDTSQLSDMIIGQTGIGSVLKQSCNDSDDDEDVDMVQESDVFGVTSVINLTSHKETPCVQEIYTYLEEICNQSPTPSKSELKQAVNQCQKLGLIINERFLNIPAKISALMLASLQDEIARLKKKDSAYDFEYYIIISKTWKPKGGGDFIFANDEEELFQNEADYSFEFSVANKSDTGLTGSWHSDDKELIPYRNVILFKANKFSNIVSAVKNFVQA